MDRIEKLMELLVENQVYSQMFTKSQGRAEEINDLANQICSLFEPKPGKSRLLSDEALVSGFDWEHLSRTKEWILKYLRSVAEAQLAHCEPLIRADERERVLKELGFSK